MLPFLPLFALLVPSTQGPLSSTLLHFHSVTQPPRCLLLVRMACTQDCFMVPPPGSTPIGPANDVQWVPAARKALRRAGPDSFSFTGGLGQHGLHSKERRAISAALFERLLHSSRVYGRGLLTLGKVLSSGYGERQILRREEWLESIRWGSTIDLV